MRQKLANYWHDERVNQPPMTHDHAKQPFHSVAHPTPPCGILTGVKKVSAAPRTSKRPSLLSEVWFQHESPKRLDFIVPLSYHELRHARGSDMDEAALDRYVNDRTVQEDGYRTTLGLTDDERSFVYATVVGFHRMRDAADYPGFTYFFRLTRDQAEDALFGVVTGDPALSMPPERGVRALERCMEHWNRHSAEFVSVEDVDLGVIDPRIEAVIPFHVRPTHFVTQAEDRQQSATGRASCLGRLSIQALDVRLCTMP